MNLNCIFRPNYSSNVIYDKKEKKENDKKSSHNDYRKKPESTIESMLIKFK